MVELGNRLGLTLEALLSLRAQSELLTEDFDGHGAVEAGVPGLVDLAHTPRTDRREDLVGA